MKKLILTFSSLALSFSLMANLGGEETTTKKNFKTLPQQFSEKLTNFELEPAGLSKQVIFIEYHIDNNLKVVVDRMRGNNTRLEQHLLKELQRHHFYIDRSEVGKKMNVKITFN